MTELVLLTSPDCHLCQHGRTVLDELATELPLTWREESSETPEGGRLAAAAPPLRPVLFDASGSVLGYGRLSTRRLRRQLSRRAA